MMHLRTKLASTRKGDMSMVVYFAKMKEYVDEMVAAGRKLDNDDVVSYILTGLDVEYNGLIENVSAKADPISINDMFAQLLPAEARIENQTQVQMSVNAVARGGGSFRGRGGRGYRRGFGRGYGRGHGSGDRPTCQICEKVGHSVGKCWKRFDCEFKLEEKSVNNAASSYDASYDVDTNWYTDTGATDNVTSELEKLSARTSTWGRKRSRRLVAQV
jgi:hypothetical protein